MINIIIPVKDPEPYLDDLIEKIDNIFSCQTISYEILVQKERGLTNAVVEGVRRCRGDLIVVMDGDGSHDPYFIPFMGHFLEIDPGIDLVVGYKIHDESAWYRKIISWIYRNTAKLCIGTHVKDPMSGFVMGRKSLFESIQPNMDYKFLLQLIIQDPTVMNFPIFFLKRQAGKSKANVVTGLRTFYSIFKYGIIRRISI